MPCPSLPLYYEQLQPIRDRLDISNQRERNRVGKVLTDPASGSEIGL
nr:hypothetical protein [Candidatus Electrothrix aestuarii]